MRNLAEALQMEELVIAVFRLDLQVWELKLRKSVLLITIVMKEFMKSF